MGNFDGLHQGHQRMLDRLVQEAKDRGLRPILVTFFPHPRALFSREKQPRIYRFRDQYREIVQCYPDVTWVVLPFNQALASLSPDVFIQSIILDKLRARYVLVGDDFRFGRGRSGGVEDIQRYLPCDAMPTHTYLGERVSSYRVKQELAQGHMTLVHALLGRPYQVSGPVVYGQQLGRQWGVPTANIHLGGWIPVLSGVFVVSLSQDGFHWLPAVASIGKQPTLHDGHRHHLEVHLLDWQGDLYGHYCHVRFWHRMRDERKFDDLDCLRHQILKDVEDAHVFWQGHRHLLDVS
jgi:riboflavin kinase/FMN adenylyltransferase